MLFHRRLKEENMAREKDRETVRQLKQKTTMIRALLLSLCSHPLFSPKITVAILDFIGLVLSLTWICFYSIGAFKFWVQNVGGKTSAMAFDIVNKNS